jgi:hypothetical protein
LNDLIQLSSSSSPPSSSSLPPSLPRSPTPLIIRNGVCVDNLGHLPTALMHSLEETLSIPRLCFHLIGSTIPPRLTLAAFNLALVGIASEPTSCFSSSPHGLSYQTTQLQIPTEVLSRLTPTSSPHESSSSLNTRRLILNYEMNETSVHLLPCKGLGIVSDVDAIQAIVHLIHSPSLEEPLFDFSAPASTSSPLSLLHLIRGSLQLPTSLIYNISGQVCTPYLCSENFGEGSASLYARTNLKRRIHNKQQT